MSRTDASASTGYPGVISILEVYTLDEAKRRMRWTDSSVRAARRKGLRLLRFGKRKYISGKEIRRYLESVVQP